MYEADVFAFATESSIKEYREVKRKEISGKMLKEEWGPLVKELIEFDKEERIERK